MIEVVKATISIILFTIVGLPVVLALIALNIYLRIVVFVWKMTYTAFNDITNDEGK